MEEKPDFTGASTSPQPVQFVQTGFPVQKIYTNSFSLGLSSSDLFLILMVNGQPTHQLNMSLVTARSIINSMTQALNDFEKKTSIKVPDINEVQKLLSKP